MTVSLGALVMDVTVSTVDPAYALATQQGCAKNGRDIGYASALMVGTPQSANWVVLNFGTGGLGCQVPKPVRRDLDIDQQRVPCA
jgi:hypothetical protein